ncbi:MAG: nucleotidyltransferase domain-containing protein [Candidatus Nanoarchaeia archaeon]|nr:nucleotidyltransferase domain-containing protein [Candidatus Nanoarchaeia archaeon]
MAGRKLKGISPLEMNEAYQRVMQWFYSFPTGYTGLTELSEFLSIAKTTARRVVMTLSEAGFLKVETIGKMWRISCNPSHPYNFTWKVTYNLNLIFSSFILNEIHKAIPCPKAIILFGSYRKGDDIETSDLDIAVEVIGNEPPKIIELGRLDDFGYRKNVPVHLYVFSRNNIDINLFANIANGIVLEGFLEARP